MKRDKAIGLDIGQTSAKALVLSRSGKKAVIRRSEIFRSREEGLRGDDDVELFNAVGGWLKELKLGVPFIYLGMPQFMATTQISDFAQGAKGEELEKMVGYETMQLSGLSDESFVYDYHAMPPGNGRKNPVMIGICREQNLNDYCDRATNAEIKLDDVAMNGLAVANAFFGLHPEAMAETRPQVLLDVGAENTTMVVVVGGQVLYVGGMMAGGQQFTQTLMRELGLKEEEAEKMKLQDGVDWLKFAPSEEPEPPKQEHVEPLIPEDMNLNVPSPEADDDSTSGLRIPKLDDDETEVPVISLDDDDDVQKPAGLRVPSLDSADGDIPIINLDDEPTKTEIPAVEPVVEPPKPAVPIWQRLAKIPCFRSFQSEFANNMEHWQSSEQEPLSTAPVLKIWLSGGGAKLKALRDFLGDSQACPCEVYGPVLENGGAVEPEYVIAYGLALQGIGLADLPISLAPRMLRWFHEKESKFKYLLIAAVILFLCLFGGLAYSYYWLAEQREELDLKKEELNKCVTKIPELDKAQSDIAYYQSKMIPFVDRGHRAARFMRTLDELQKAMNPGDWCIYVGDKVSYDEYKVEQEKAKAKEQAEKEPRGRGGSMFDRHGRGNERQQEEKEEVRTISVMEIEPLTTMVAVGFTRKRRDPKTHQEISSYDTTLDIQNRLNRKKSTDSEPEPDAYFAGVDTMPRTEQSGREDAVMDPWFQYLENTLVNQAQPPYVLGVQYNKNPFVLKMPFKTQDIDKPASADNGKGKDKDGNKKDDK
ncbi:MAG: pilus assembly protein PilM [Victivallales bacterium]|nr:pilus assembly protein PilM [Victivallales bacterium]